MKVFVAVPAYDGRVGVAVIRALLTEQLVAVTKGHEIQFVFLANTSLITLARNQLAQEFLDSDAERLFFLDSDVSWAEGDLVKVATAPAYVVGGAYRYKTPEEAYPVGWLDSRADKFARDANGLIEVASLPTGFLAISKSVFHRLMEAEDRAYAHGGQKFHAFFTAPFRDGTMYGEDAAFCRDWRDVGGRMFLDPDVTLTHHDGPNAYTGTAAAWIAAHPPKE